MTRGDAWGGVGQGSKGTAGEKNVPFVAGIAIAKYTNVCGRASDWRKEEGSSQAWIRPEEKQTREARSEQRAAITYTDERWDRQRAGDGETEFVRRGSWKKCRGARPRETYVFRLAAGACARSVE